MSRKLIFLTLLALVPALAATNTAFSAVTWEDRVASQNDDAEESITNAGAIDLGSSDLELPYENAGKGNNQIIGIRFVSVAVDKGAAITNAYVEFTCDETKDGTLPVSLLIDGEKNPNPAQFTGTTNEISTKPRTTAKVVWAPANWTAIGQKDKTSNIASIIQEIVNQDGWASGNALVLMLRDDPANPSQGTRCADSFSDSATAALLHIEYSSKYATDPNPPDGSLYGDTWVNMTWSPGDTAVSHDVYFSDNQDDVTNGTGDAFRGNQATAFYIAGFPGYPYPDGLVPGTTYYWRIDEVEADGVTKYTGPVWSFTVPPKKAYDPNPANGTQYIQTDTTLNWTPGFGAKMHYAYFGTDFDTVSNAAGGMPQALATYKPASLAKNTTYYWRVDEFDGAVTYKGDVWSFKTITDITITDPDMIGWWKFDEGFGTTAFDFSGHGNDGTLQRNAQWVEGIMGGAVDLPGNAYVTIDGVVDDITSTNITLSAWVKTTASAEGELFAANDGSGAHPFMFGVWHGNPFVNDGSDTEFPPAVNDDQWHMLTYVRNGSSGSIYVDGVQHGTYTPGFSLDSVTRWSIGQEWDGSSPSDFFVGTVDDARFYNKSLTADEVVELTRGDPLLAWNPSPANGAIVDVERAKQPLTWSPGDMAAQHDVYLGLDKAAVQSADASDTSGVYRGRQNGASYTPTETLDWGTGPYYWRIDESNTDGTLSTGAIWSFSVADHLIVDDFESYDAKDNQIWFTWHDGLGYGAPGVPPYFAGNGTGAAVGDENTSSYTEETIVHSGGKSMPIAYDNNKQGFAKYSQTEMKLTAPRDWTQYGVGELSLWFRGYPGSVGSFTEAPVGTFTMTASGTDIWGTADEFHFAYKMLTGAGSIVARVDSVQNTNAWAKAGVMIRETLDPGSKHAFACVTPGNGVASQGRIDTDTDSFSVNQTGLTSPYWVKLDRDFAGRFTVSHSADGVTWQPVQGSTWTAISMSSLVYVGLALTSHDANLTCQATFSNVTITGTVSGQWAHQDIGIASNAPEPMYVALSNATGQPAVVVHDDSAAATISTWTEWVIPLQKFADQGIDLTDVDQIAIGLGTPGNMTTPGGAGKIYIDDIGLYRPRTAP
jgi:Concanavalin A-like lectin/glucanases superfamily